MTKMFMHLLQLWPQWFATTIVTLLSTNIGLTIGWTSPYLARMTSENPTPFHITNEEGSWIASLLPFGRFFGAIIGALILECIGCKTSLLLAGLSAIFSWVCIICAISPTWLYVSRTLAGIAMGILFSCFPFYIAEISTPSIRGSLVCMILSGFQIGMLFGNIMGTNMPMMQFGIISLIITLCYMSIFPFLPQSPHYYVRHNDIKRAEQVIQWYYRKSDVKSEIEAVEYFMKSTQAISIRERLNQIKEPKNTRSFVMVILLFMFMQLSGLNTILLYTEIIVKKGKVTSIMPSTVVIITNAISIIISWSSAYAIDYCGRRILLAISSFGTMISMMLLGLHFFLLDCDYDSSDIEWLIIVSLLLYLHVYIGLIPVPCLIMGEIFPPDLKSIAGLAGSISLGIFAFIASKSYQPLIELISEKYVFWLHAIIMFISFIFSLTMLPETKGKTLQEIQDMLTTRNATERSQQETSVKSRNSNVHVF